MKKVAKRKLVLQRKERRKKNLPQSQKTSQKAIKPPLWDRIGFVPNWKSVNQLHREKYEKKMQYSDGKGTGRSDGSNTRLKKLLRY